MQQQDQLQSLQGQSKASFGEDACEEQEDEQAKLRRLMEDL